MYLPGRLQNSHRNGGRVLLIFVADPRTGRLFRNMGKVYGRTPAQFAVDAVRRATEDAGLALADLDGLMVNPGTAPSTAT
jgi:predicted naringenin-chalcone synthase